MSALYHVPLLVDGTWLLILPVKSAVGLQPIYVVIQLAMNRSRRVRGCRKGGLGPPWFWKF